MKLKAIAAVVAAAPLMVACGSAENKTYTLNGAGATFPAMFYNAVLQDMVQKTLVIKSTIKQLVLVLVSVSSKQRLLTSVPPMVL